MKRRPPAASRGASGKGSGGARWGRSAGGQPLRAHRVGIGPARAGHRFRVRRSDEATPPPRGRHFSPVFPPVGALSPSRRPRSVLQEALSSCPRSSRKRGPTVARARAGSAPSSRCSSPRSSPSSRRPRSRARPTSSSPTSPASRSSVASMAARCSWLGMGVSRARLRLRNLSIYMQLQKLPVHQSMKDVSELIYETCKTYLFQQGKFIMLLVGLHRRDHGLLLRRAVEHMSGGPRADHLVLWSLVGIAGSYGVAWFGIRVNTFANSRTAFARLRGKPFPTYAIPLQAGMSIGMLLISVELFLMLIILLFVSRRTRALASSASPSASRSAPRRSASPAASSPRSPTSARTS
jgi:hypothetical protein